MEPLDGLDGEDEKFYHPYMAPLRMENTVIDFDIENLQKLLVENNKNFPVKKIAERVRDHYMDSSRLIKRAYGKKIEDDFQMYNWGLTLAMDMGLATDKLELLLNVYAKKLPRRITAPDFERIIKEHSSWRKIKDRREKAAKWLDLTASYKIHIYRKEGYPDTIGKRQFHTILDVTEVELDLDVVKITRDIRRADKYSNKLHMLLLDDPLIKGDFNAEVGKMLQDENPEDSERLRDFEARVATEEETFGAIEQEEVDARLRRAYQEKEELEEKRRLARIEKEIKRVALKKADADAKQAKLDRLAAIKADREAWEARKIADAQRTEREAHEAAARAERDELLRQELEFQDADAREVAEAARETAREAEAARVAEEKAAIAASKYAHLTPEERIRAEAADKLAEHRRQKDLERRRLLEETRRYAESHLAKRNAREMGSKVSATVDAFPDDIGSVARTSTSASAQSTKKRKVQSTVDALREDDIGRGSKSVDILEKLKQGGARATSATGVKRRERSLSPDASKAGPLPNAADTENEEKKRVRAQLMEQKRQQKEDEELLRTERSRAKLRAEEEARIQQIELAAKRKEERDLERLERRQREEDERMAKLEEQLRMKAERDERISESRALRKLEEERLAVIGDTKASDNSNQDKGSELALARAQALASKRKAAADAKREAAKMRAAVLQEEQEAKRKLIADVLNKKADQSAKAVTAKRRKLKRKDGQPSSPDAALEAEHVIDSDNMNVDTAPTGEALSGVQMLSVEELDALFPTNEDESNDLGDVEVDQSSEIDGKEMSDLEKEPSEHSALADMREGDAEALDDAGTTSSQYVFSETDDVGVPIELRNSSWKSDVENHEEALTSKQSTALANTTKEAKAHEEALAQAEAEAIAAEAAYLAEVKAFEDRKIAAEAEAAAEAKASADAIAAAEAEAIAEAKAAADAKAQWLAEAALLVEAEASAKAEEIAKAEAIALAESLAAAASVAKAAEKERISGELALIESDSITEAVVEADARVVAEEFIEEHAASVSINAVLLDSISEYISAENDKKDIEAAEEIRAQENKKREHLENERKLLEEELERKLELQRLADLADIERAEEARLAAELAQAEADAIAAEIATDIVEQSKLTAAEEIVGNDIMVSNDGSLRPGSAASSRRSSKPSIISLPAFEVAEHDHFTRPSTALNIEDVKKMPAYTVELEVPKSADGTLRINLREDSDGDDRGIFFHGFKKKSAAEAVPEAERLAAHDEVLKLAGVNVEGGSLQEVIAVLKGHSSPTVKMLVRRHHVNMGSILYEGYIPEQHVDDSEPLSPERLSAFGLPSSVRDLRELPAEVLEFDVPKSYDGTLRVIWSSANEEGYDHQAFVLSSFLPDSAAAAQGLLKAGDEVLAANHYDMEGGDAIDMQHILSTAEALSKPHVTLKVRRHHAGLGAHIAEHQSLDIDAYLADAPKHIIMDGLVTRPDIPSLDELRTIPSDTLEVLVPKSSDGTLRINLRHDDEGDTHGLFVHGFKPNSKAEAQGQVWVGDELLRVDGVDVEGQFLGAVVAVMQKHTGRDVSMMFRRHRMQSMQELGYENESGQFSARPQIKSARGGMSPRADILSPVLTARSEHDVFQIHDEVMRGADTALAELSLFPAVDIDLVVPKSKDGTLRLYIRHDDEGDAHGLFLHGFKTNSAAERQGLLKVGDELLVVAGTIIKGGFLEDLVSVLQEHAGPVVPMTIRRHIMDESDALLDEMVAHEFEAEKVAMQKQIEAEKVAMQKQMDAKFAAQTEQARLDLEAALMSAAAEDKDDGDDDDPVAAERKAARKKQLDVLIQQQKKQRQLRMEKEAEERAIKARAMPNSLLTDRAVAIAEKSKPWTDFDCAVPKTGGELRLHVKHSHKKGLFIHGFKPGSLAEAQGIVQEGDELLSVEGHDVHGKSLHVLVGILKTHSADVVNAKFRRHRYRM